MTTPDRIRTVHSGAQPALAWASEALDLARQFEGLNSLREVLADDAMEAASKVDLDPAGLPLAGMPFVAKDLFDIRGKPTLAGSKINLQHAPATQDATLVARMKAAGAVLIGISNMDEYAYGFVTENAHYGATRNPHDPSRSAGGSSGGSAAAVAAGIVPVALGSDTNGSIRVPAAFCGIYGLKPTFGRLSRAGSYPFADSLDHVGPFARTLTDLALTYNLLQGPDPRDPSCTAKAPSLVAPDLEPSFVEPRIGILDGWFQQGATDAVLESIERIAMAFRCVKTVSLHGAEAARSAAFCLTGIEGASLHKDHLRERAHDFDPAVRDRLLAGLMMPAHLLMQARRVRQKLRQEAQRLFEEVDILIAPVTPGAAPKIGEKTMLVDGREIPVRANLGLYTQPISFIGLPVLAAPVCMPGLPIGIQLIAPGWAEDRLFQVAAFLEQAGRIGAKPIPAIKAGASYS